MKGVGFLVLIILLVTSVLPAQEYQIYQGDTINRRDAMKKRVGRWIFFDAENNIQSEGHYKNSRKDGLWVLFYPNGKRRAEITYTAGRKKGPAKTYYEDGTVAEQGYWDANKWTGSYKAYHENGKLAYDWNYNESGKKVGEQKYFFPNGKVMIQGNWENGKITGTLTEFYSDGGVKAERKFVDGKVDHSRTRFHVPQKPDVAKKDSLLIKNLPPGNQDKTDNSEKQITSYFTGEGFHKLYKDSLLSREGVFRGGKLFDGKHYLYNEQGKLIQTRVYRSGKLIDILREK